MRLAILLCLLMWVASAQSPTPGVRLESGIAKEDVDGDLKSAIEIYRTVANDQSAPRDVRAKALLRLAGCYEKLGRQARQVYEQVVRDYADQPAATQARSRLAALKQQEHPAEPTTMTVRKIENSSLVTTGATDTDGRRAVYFDSGDLIFGDLSGHTRRVIFKPEPNDLASFWTSRDFSFVALVFHQKQGAPPRLAVIKTDGTGYRGLIPDDAQASVLGSEDELWCCRWSWDSHYLLAARNPKTGGGHLTVISVSDGKRREIAALSSGQFVKAVFSPDGRYVAYEVAPQPGQVAAFRTFVLPSQGGEPQLVYESVPKQRRPPWSERLALMDWTADGRDLLIADARYGNTGLYLYPITNGATVGDPALVRSGDITEGSTTTFGAFVFQTQKNTRLYLASLDADGRLGGWRRLDVRRGNPYNSLPSFSPDGREIAYVVSEQDLAGAESLVVRNLSTGQERELYRSDKILSCQYQNQHPVIFCTERKIDGKTDVLSIAADSGEIRRFGSYSQRSLIRPSYNDQALYLQVHKSTTTYEGPIVRWELATGKENVVSSDPADRSYEMPSVDDRWLVRLSPHNLSVRPISGGDWKVLVSRSSLIGPVATSPDSKWVLYQDTDENGKHCLFRLPIDGGQPQRLGNFAVDYFSGGSLHVSPDGRQLLVVAFERIPYDLWVLDHFVLSGKQ